MGLGAWRGQRSWVGVSGAHLDARGDVVDNTDGLGVSETRQRVGNEVEFHLPGWLSPRLFPVDGLAGGTLQAAILGRGKLEVSPQVSSPHLAPWSLPTHCPAWPTLLPLEYMATRHSRWYMWPQRPRRPTSSGRTPLCCSTPS
jgi:hypothetical protein